MLRCVHIEYDVHGIGPSFQPVHGYSTPNSLTYQPTQNGLFSVAEQKVRLTDVAFSSPVDSSSLPHHPTVSGTHVLLLRLVFDPCSTAVWLMLEGNPIVNETGGKREGEREHLLTH